MFLKPIVEVSKIFNKILFENIFQNKVMEYQISFRYKIIFFFFNVLLKLLFILILLFIN